MTRATPPVRRLLMDAKALIAKPKNFCRREVARDASGRPVDLQSPRAVRFCCLGAIWRGNDKWPRRQIASNAEDRLRLFVPDGHIASFNDAPTTTHPIIMRLFNKAILLAKEQGI